MDVAVLVVAAGAAVVVAVAVALLARAAHGDQGQGDAHKGGVPVRTALAGRTALAISRLDEIAKVYKIGQGLVYRGVTSGAMPFPLPAVFNTLFEHRGAYFFGQMEDDLPAHHERHAATTAILDRADVTEAAKAVAEAAKRGDDRGAMKATMRFVISLFKPDFAASMTDADVNDAIFVGLMVLPSLRWLSPLHSVWLRGSKERLVTRLGGIDYLHHLVVAGALWTTVLRFAVSRRGLAKIHAAGDKGFPVIRLFDKAIPDEVMRIVKTETDLGGLSPFKLQPGNLVIFKLLSGDLVEQRFLTCCAKYMVTRFVEAVVRNVDPTVNLISAASNGSPLQYAAAASAAKPAETEAGGEASAAGTAE
eukprot:Unigene5244_Nuclearia_a/m.16098 Unigene5244_Nuclearia_a/g.16098  ORF Unigene5244_Nuclearia_a/g.16098 Unigene5244_Nuclearia_a/m.16098 type:complete len:363 (+) Unigene5244_Nuclearia_a:16-1104(+)